MKRRSLLAAALAAGALAGAAGAAVHAQDTPAPAPAPAIPVDLSDPARLPDGRYSPERTQYRVHDARIVARVADPAGGPAWALRTFNAERLALQRPARTLDGARVVGRDRCVQLGRVQGDTFGWIYGDGRFHELGIEDQLLQCTAAKRPQVQARMAFPLTIADPAAPHITGSVVWGLLPGTHEATVSGSGAADGAAAVEDGAFLRVAGPDAHPDGATVTGNGHTVKLGPAPLPSSITSHFRFPALVPGTATVEAPAPDPAGGPRWGIPVARTSDGGACSAGPTRVVDGRAGGVDLRLALFFATTLTGEACRPLETRPNAKRACDAGIGYGSDPVEDAFLQRARSERRLLTGRLTIYAQCAADVVRVTVRTPRDIRTLFPSSVGHVILAVYDGDFVDGRVELTAHRRHGRAWRETLPLGF